jgi:hypothetical protein
MFSGVGPLFLLLIGAELVLDGTRRRALITLVPPALIFAVWYVTIGKRGVTEDPFHLTLRDLSVLIEYVPNGIGAAVAGIFGLSSQWSRLALAGLTAVAALALTRGRRASPQLVAAILALVAMYALTGYERGKLGIDQGAAARYIYVGGVFALLILSEVVRDLRWSASWIALLGLVVIAGACYDAKVLNDQIAARNIQSAQAVVELQTMTAVCSAPGLRDDILFAPETMPSVSPARYCAGIRSIGSPVPNVPLQDVQQRDAADSDATLRRVFSSALWIGPATPGPATGHCPVIGKRVVMSAPAGGELIVQSTSAGVPLQISLSSAEPPPSNPSATVTAPAGTSRIELPDTGQRMRWQVGLSAPESARLTVCQPPPG